MHELATKIRAEKLAKLDAKLSAIADGKGIYEAGADGFDLSEQPTAQEGEEMTENTPEARQEVSRSVWESRQYFDQK